MKSMLLVPVLLSLGACSGGEAVPQPTPPTPIDVAAPVPVSDPTKETSAGYAIGVKKIAQSRAQMQTLLDAGKLDQLHKVGEEVSTTAKALPGTCESLGATQKADVAAQAQKLQDLFGALDEAGDGGDKEKSADAIKAYDAPIAALQGYLP